MDHDFATTPNGTIGQNSNKIVEEERPTISVVIDEDDEGEEDDVVEEGSNPKGSATEHYIHSSDKMSFMQMSALNLDHNYVSGTPSREVTAAASQGKTNFPVLHGLNIDDVEEQANTFPALPKTYPVQRRPIKLSGYGHGPAAGDYYKQHLKGVLLGPPNRAFVSNLQQQHKQQQQQRFSPRLLSLSSASSVGSGWHGHQHHTVSAAAPIVAPRIAPRGRPPGSGSRARQQSSAIQPIYNSGIAPMVQQQQHFEEQQHLMTRRGEQQQQQQHHRQQQQHNTFADVMEEEEMENEKFFLQQQQQMGGGPPQQHSTTVLRGRRPKKQRDEEMFDTTSMSYQQHHQQQQQQESSKPPDDPVPCQQSVVNHHQQLQQQHNHHQQPYESSIDSAIDSVVRGDALVMQNFAPSSSSSACFGAATASSSSTLAQLFHSHTASAPTITTSTSTSLARQQHHQPQQHSFVEHHSPPRHHQHAPTAVAGGSMMTHHYPQYLHRHPMIPTVAKQSLSPPSQSLEDLADLAQASSSLLQQTTNSMLRTQPAAAAAATVAAAAAAAAAYQQQPPLVQPVQKQQPTLHFKVVATNNQPENYPPKEYRQQVFTVQQQQQLDEEASKTTVVKKLTKKQMETIQCEFGELRPDGTAKENAGATPEPKQQQQQQLKRVRKSTETAEAIKSADDDDGETRAAADRPLRRSAGVGRPKRSTEIGQQMIKKKRNWEGVDDYVTRCICGTRHTDPFMIECDQCDVWQHGVCMGVTKKTVPEQYFCEQCKPRELLLTASQAAAKQKAFLASLPPPPVSRRGRKKKLKLKQEQLQHKRMLGRRPAEPLSSATQLGSVLRGNVQKRRGRPPKRRFPGAAVAGAVMPKISNTKSPSVTTSPTTTTAMGRTFDRETAEVALRDNVFDDTCAVGALADKIVEGEQQQLLKELVVQTTPIENCYSRAVKALMAQLSSGSRTHLALLQRLKNNAPLARQMYVAPNVEGLVATPGDLARVETGTPLIEYNGMISLLSEVQSRTPSKLNQHNFTLIYNGLGESKELFVDACRVVSDARAVRKSCRPNAAVKHAISDGQIHIYLVATTDIDKSTEVTIPFDSDYWDSCVPVECACGFSKNQSSSPGGMRCPVQEFNEALSSGDLASFEAKKMKRLTRSFGNTTGGGTTRAEDGAATGGSSGQQQQQHTDNVDNNTNRQLDKNIPPNDGGGDMKTIVKMETPKAKKSEDGGGAAGLKIIKMETLKKRSSDGGSGGMKFKMETLKKRKSDGGGGMKTTPKLETFKKSKPRAEIPFHQLCAELGRILHKKLVDNAIDAEEFKLPPEFDALRVKCDKEREKKVKAEMKEEQQHQQKSLKRKATSKDAEDDKEANLLPSFQPKKEKEEEKLQQKQQHGVEVEEEEEQKGTEADGIGRDQQQKGSPGSFVVQQTGAEIVPAVELIASSSSSAAAAATTSTPESSARLPNTKALKKITIDEYKRKRMAEMAEKPALTKSSSTSAVKDRSSQQQQSPPVAVRQSPRKSFFPIVVNVPSPPQQIEDFPSLSPPAGIGGRQQLQAVSAVTSLSAGRMTKTTSSTIDELKKRILGSGTGGLPAPSGLPPLTQSSSYLSAGAAGLSATSTVAAGASVAAEPQHPPLPDLATAPPHKAQLQPRVSLEERLRARFGSGGRKK